MSPKKELGMQKHAAFQRLWGRWHQGSRMTLLRWGPAVSRARKQWYQGRHDATRIHREPQHRHLFRKRLISFDSLLAEWIAGKGLPMLPELTALHCTSLFYLTDRKMDKQAQARLVFVVQFTCFSVSHDWASHKNHIKYVKYVNVILCFPAQFEGVGSAPKRQQASSMSRLCFPELLRPQAPLRMQSDSSLQPQRAPK